jgi:HAD superfamily hydrolase (TIGR01549 family)
MTQNVARGPAIRLSPLPWTPSTPLRAIVFDVDGTLYHAARMRRMMLMRLARAYALRPREGWKVARILGSYRRAQETLRVGPDQPTDLEARQQELAMAATGADRVTVGAYVERWMRSEPDAVLVRCMDKGLPEFLEFSSRRSIRLAVLSDYPAESKLVAMGIRPYFDTVVTAQDGDVRRFKPDPRGLEVALDRLGVGKEEALYVGDRPEVDGVAAQRASVPFVLIGRRERQAAWPSVTCFDELRDAITA